LRGALQCEKRHAELKVADIPAVMRVTAHYFINKFSHMLFSAIFKRTSVLVNSHCCAVSLVCANYNTHRESNRCAY
jgi:hypothetical protein